ncbi:hypothetical protein HK102_008487 [Quaeritorhiza haematococci]|nr:hypothetical protein HK102_008487 [Quaeritorhiza haematococci]
MLYRVDLIFCLPYFFNSRQNIPVGKRCDPGMKAEHLDHEQKMLQEKRVHLVSKTVEEHAKRRPAPEPYPTTSTTTEQGSEEASQEFLVCIRTRPLLPHEVERGHVNALTTSNPRTWLHVAEQRWNGQYEVKTTKFRVDYTFGPEHGNEEVYSVVAPPVLKLALGGGVGTIFAYGQTNSGKTYTMTGIEEGVARDLFNMAQEYRTQQSKESANGDSGFTFKVSFLEIFGSKVTDLLSDETSEAAPHVQIFEDMAGSINVKDCTEHKVTSSEEMLALISRGASNRLTRDTGKNDRSSRSHAVFRVRIVNERVPEAEDGWLYLVDLSGSESAADAAKHDRVRILETKEINKSLATLKECVRNRALAAGANGDSPYVHIPYRSSKLTFLLKDVFELTTRKPCRTFVIANVSSRYVKSIS